MKTFNASASNVTHVPSKLFHFLMLQTRLKTSSLYEYEPELGGHLFWSLARHTTKDPITSIAKKKHEEHMRHHLNQWHEIPTSDTLSTIGFDRLVTRIKQNTRHFRYSLVNILNLFFHSFNSLCIEVSILHVYLRSAVLEIHFTIGAPFDLDVCLIPYLFSLKKIHHLWITVVATQLLQTPLFFCWYKRKLHFFLYDSANSTLPKGTNTFFFLL